MILLTRLVSTELVKLKVYVSALLHEFVVSMQVDRHRHDRTCPKDAKINVFFHELYMHHLYAINCNELNMHVWTNEGNAVTIYLC